MAIIDIFPEIQVDIVHNNEPFHEYKDTDIQDNDDRFTRRYIEAKSDQPFAIRINIAEGFDFKGDCLDCSIRIDGTLVSRGSIDKARFAQKDHDYIIDAKRAGGDLVQKFKFAALEIVPDRNTNNAEVEKVKGLGTIKVEFIQAYVVKKMKTQTTYTARGYKRAEDFGIVSEKAVVDRRLSHSVGFGEMEERPRKPGGEMWYTTNVEDVPTPAAALIFQYRSLESLKCMDIIPRTPSPPPPMPLEERDITTLSPAELVEMQDQLRTIKEEQVETAVKIKREHEEAVKIKQEHEARDKCPRKRQKKTHFEIGKDGSFLEVEGPPVVAADAEVVELD